MNFLNIFSRQYAHFAHNLIKQTRKYTGEPYHRHTDNVRKTVKTFGGNKYQLAAADLHDVREDVFTKLKADKRWFALWVMETIYNWFPYQVRVLVSELTDVYTSENYPDKNRAWRKEREAFRISLISDEGKLIKLADLFDNTYSIVEHDKGFAITYLKEKARVMNGLEIDSPLFLVVRAQLKINIDKLNIVV